MRPHLQDWGYANMTKGMTTASYLYNQSLPDAASIAVTLVNQRYHISGICRYYRCLGRCSIDSGRARRVGFRWDCLEGTRDGR